MISCATLSSSADAARYHDSALATDGNIAKEADNYYVNDNAIATWQGEAAKLLGIEGEKVSREDFINFLDGKITNPKDGQLQDLAANSKGENRRLGYDFTISAPKSVSIVGLVGNDQRVITAHKEANARAMAWLEKHGAQIRVKDANGDNQIVHTDNLLYATVQHETSRANDPQLHNHNVIVGATYDKVEGKWRSLTNDELFNIRATADKIYKNELAILLKEAGYQIEVGPNGVDFEIKGISAEQLTDFSERTAQINAALEARGISPQNASHAARQTAALDSRSAKSELTKEVILEIWNEKARESGLDIGALVERASAASVKERDVSGINSVVNLALDKATEHLSEREQSFKVSDLEAQAVYFSGHTTSIGEVQAAIAERMTEKVLVEREGQKARFVTTSAAIAQEMTLQDSIMKGKGKGATVFADQVQFDAALAKFEARKSLETNSQFKLSAEQVTAARNVLMHNDKFQGIQGDAGTGKTAALEFVKEAALTQGWAIKGIGTSTTAARELQNATGIESSTVAAFMLHNDKQLKMLKSDLDRLSIDIAHSADNAAKIKQVERSDLNLKGKGSDFGLARYVFDNKTGNVFKSNAGPLNVINSLGHKLSDAGNQHLPEAKAEWAKAEKLSDRFKAGVSLLSAKTEVSLGKSLASYQIVGKVEAVAARDAHETERLRSYNKLLSEYGVKQAQMENLLVSGNVDGKKFLLVMDESSMTGTKDSARLSEIARELGARVVLQGDIKQHGSVAAGRALEQSHQAGINLSKIEETRRFDNATPQTKNAIAEMKLGKYANALRGLDTIEVGKGDPSMLYEKVAERYVANRDELKAGGHADPKVGIVAITNTDRKGINVAVRDELKKTGELSGADFKKEHLDDPKLTQAERKYVPSLRSNKVDRMTAMKNYKSLGIKKDDTLSITGYNSQTNTLTAIRPDGKQIVISPEKNKNFNYTVSEMRDYAIGDKVEARANIGRLQDPDRITNGERGVVAKVDANGATIKWDGNKTREITFTNDQMRHVDHAYAHTSYKEQGVTNAREIIAVSDIGAKVFNKLAAYVAASRAKDNTEIVTSDLAAMLKNAGAEQTKTTAIDIAPNVKENDAKRISQEQSLALQDQFSSTQTLTNNTNAPTIETTQDRGLSI